MSWLDDGPPIPELEGWSPVGEARLEWGAGNTSTDFDLLLLEQVLLDNAVQCMFYPHRPNEGFNLGRPVPDAVSLYVPNEQLARAQQLAEELANATILEDGESEPD